MLRRLAYYVAFPIIAIVVNYTPAFVWVIVDFVLDIWLFWVRKLYYLHTRKDTLKEHVKLLKNVESYNEFKAVVTEIDRLTNMDLWRQNFVLKHYDYILINDRMELLREARLNEDAPLIMSLLRSGLIRNFGGIAQKRLYTKSYLGTKFKIQEYITEVLECLNYINLTIQSESSDDYIMNSKQLRIDFFHDARQLFGCTALILQGGSLFGLCHLGVVRALYFKGLLPRVIGGSAVGAAVASLVCTLTDSELIPVLVSITDVMGDVDKLNHDVDERYGNVIENVIRKGYSQDILIFLKFVRDTIGDLTFEEAYLKTQKILNIVVHPTNMLVPSLLNYITAPNVIIWTAIYASIGTGVLSDNIQLYAKDFNDEMVPVAPHLNVSYLKPQDVNNLEHYFRRKSSGGQGGRSHLLESPYIRLTELFNVNHFITSLARPYLAPMINNDLKHHITYGKVRFDEESYESRSLASWRGEEQSSSLEKAKISPEKPKISPVQSKHLPNDSNYNIMKHIKNVIAMEVQHRLEVMNKLGILPEIIKRLCIDEKPSTGANFASSLREITIVPELRYLVRDFGRVFDVHKTMENIPYWILVGERSVWPLFPLIWSRCAIEFELDDLYSNQKR
ncbi:CIC11C00000000165 [Sungouiella intermedia]|uniref:CIC11C00000000165 n=1 Tax=Sungouiella intermedia TaxID=45354 RepID=A0A1L0FW45_9ASCO|nr:CIC11C00000000165 [[Candida] intermedia]